jgi:hypothetical protein
MLWLQLKNVLGALTRRGVGIPLALAVVLAARFAEDFVLEVGDAGDELVSFGVPQFGLDRDCLRMEGR